jgi:phosphoglycerol transferase
MAEGIDFTKPGYPSFLAEVQGMSLREDWGRWTDGRLAPAAKFRLKQPLPKSFTLVLKANAFGPNLDKPVKVRVGGVEKSFVHKDGSTAGTYRLAFELPSAADTIEIVAPAPASPQEQNPSNPDQRKLGVGLSRMQFEN